MISEAERTVRRLEPGHTLSGPQDSESRSPIRSSAEERFTYETVWKGSKENFEITYPVSETAQDKKDPESNRIAFGYKTKSNWGCSTRVFG